MSWVLSLRDTEQKHTVLFIEEMSRKSLIKTLKSRSDVAAATLEILRRSSLGLKHHWSIWGTMEPRTTKRKNCKTFYAKRESVMRLPQDTALNQMDWPRDSTSPSCTRFAACLSMQTWHPSSGLMLHIMRCSSTITSLILPSITTRVQTTLMETHLIFRNSTSSVVFVMLFGSVFRSFEGIAFSQVYLSSSPIHFRDWMRSILKAAGLSFMVPTLTTSSWSLVLISCQILQNTMHHNVWQFTFTKNEKRRATSSTSSPNCFTNELVLLEDRHIRKYQCLCPGEQLGIKELPEWSIIVCFEIKDLVKNATRPIVDRKPLSTLTIHSMYPFVSKKDST